MPATTPVSPSLDVPVSLVNDSPDRETFLRDAEKMYDEYANKETTENASVVEVAKTVLAGPQLANVKHFTAKLVGSLVATAKGELPLDATVASYAKRCKSFLDGEESLIVVRAGRNTGYWQKSLLTPEETKKLGS